MKGIFGFRLRRSAVVVHDMVMVTVAWTLAYGSRFNFSMADILIGPALQTFPVVLVVQSSLLWATGLYRSLWRFASIPDLWNITRAATLGVLAVLLCLFVLNRLEGVPRSTLLLYPILLVFLLGAPRLIYRMWKDHGLIARSAGKRQRVLLIGAGRAGEMLARDMQRDGEYVAVGFVDDKRQLRGAKVHGIPVVGTIADLPRVVKDLSVDVIVIAIPSATNREMLRVVELCEQSGVPFRTLPRLQDVVSGRSPLGALREVSLEDFLGREPVSLDWRKIAEGLVGKTVLVTGGGGSIGSELCRQIACLGPKELVLFERGEFNIYSIEMELRREFPNLAMSCHLGDVCDSESVEHVLSTHRPNVVFHAAAYKHVPILESYPRQAVRNNILGTKLLAEAADKHGVETFVMISTDKAVRPANVMGASKRVAELFCQALSARSKTKFITVRFGNVLGSAGSVVPLFQKQIELGGPVTVTHPEITRYFMTIPEACQLIMQASVMGKGGEIFVLDMGEPIKITYLAEQMIRLAGKTPGKDIEIIYTGLRPGEKLYEELFYEQESLSATPHKKIHLAKSMETNWTVLRQRIADLEKASECYDEPVLLGHLGLLVPELLAKDNVDGDGNVIEFKRA